MADWTTQAADAIEAAVSVVRERAVVPAQKATEVVVAGTVVAFFAVLAVLLLIIGVFRALVILTGEAWIAYFAVGGMLVVAGGFCWSRRASRPS